MSNITTTRANFQQEVIPSRANQARLPAYMHRMDDNCVNSAYYFSYGPGVVGVIVFVGVSVGVNVIVGVEVAGGVKTGSASRFVPDSICK